VHALPGLPPPEHVDNNIDVSQRDNQDSDTSTTNMDDKIHFADMQAALQPGPEATLETEYSLPEHKSCASHTLNLIATRDAAKATADSAYKRVYHSTTGKCSAMWNKSNRSVQAANIIKDKLKVCFKVTNDTRWNSQVDALD
jgi:glycyl-tRNA synthetase alpha subunit